MMIGHGFVGFGWNRKIWIVSADEVFPDISTYECIDYSEKEFWHFYPYSTKTGIPLNAYEWSSVVLLINCSQTLVDYAADEYDWTEITLCNEIWPP